MSSQRAVSAARGGGGGDVGKVIRSPSCWSWLVVAGGGWWWLVVVVAVRGQLGMDASLLPPHCLAMLTETLH